VLLKLQQSLVLTDENFLDGSNYVDRSRLRRVLVAAFTVYSNSEVNMSNPTDTCPHGLMEGSCEICSAIPPLSDTIPGAKVIIRIENPEVFVGLNVEEAQRRIAEHGYESRIVHNNAWTATILKDYDPLRVQLSVDDKIVTKAKIG
jgi:hypothetical protein